MILSGAPPLLLLLHGTRFVSPLFADLTQFSNNNAGLFVQL